MPFSCTAIYFGNVYETLEHDPPNNRECICRCCRRTRYYYRYRYHYYVYVNRPDGLTGELIYSFEAVFANRLKPIENYSRLRCTFWHFSNEDDRACNDKEEEEDDDEEGDLCRLLSCLYLIRYWLQSRAIRKYLQFIQTNIKIKFKYAYRGKYLRRICGLFIWLWR